MARKKKTANPTPSSSLQDPADEAIKAPAGDGVALTSAAHPGSELSDESLETVEIDVDMPPVVAAAVERVVEAACKANKAQGWAEGKLAALKMIRAELETEECEHNGQAWINCTNAIGERVAKLENPYVA